MQLEPTEVRPAGLSSLLWRARGRSPNHIERYVGLLLGGDVAAMVVAGALAPAVAFGPIWTESDAGRTRFSYVAVIAAMVLMWLAVIALKGGYALTDVGAGPEEFHRVADAAVTLLAAVASAAFVLRHEWARGIVAVVIPLAAVLTLALRYAARRWLHAQRARGKFVDRAVVVGSEEAARAVVQCLTRAHHARFLAAAVCVPGGCGPVELDGHLVPTTGMPDDVVSFARSVNAHAVVVATGSPFVNGALQHLAWRLEGSGIALLAAPEIAGMPEPRVAIHPVADLPLLRFREPELSGPSQWAKAAIDRAGAALALAILLPLFAAVALAIRLTSGAPVLFRQVRVGRDGREFVMWKLRTMVVDAEDRLPELADRNEHDGILFKIRDDPRVTAIGRALRRWSLDELPQLWNVLRGDMSLVGPRPPLPSEVARYDTQTRRRLRVKPGMTGLWQVSGRAHLSWEESVRLDLRYIQNWSPTLDTMILARTVVAVIRGRGAC